MAGFFLWDSSVSIASEKVQSSFGELDYKEGTYLHFKTWNIVIFQKKLYDIQNFKIFPDGIICCTGTFGYKGKVYEQALNQIFSEIQSNSIDLSAFWGSFSIIILNDRGVTLLRDGAGLSRIYQYSDQPVYSSSFAGLINILDEKMTLNTVASTELLASGVLTGDATIVNEIKRVLIGTPQHHITVFESKAKEYSAPHNRTEALNQQIEIAKKYYTTVFNDFLNYMPDIQFDIGITGGMDSRLNAVLAMHTVDKSKISLHTHWRKAGLNDSDYKYAHIFSEKTSIPLHIREVIHPHDMSQDELIANFEAAYALSDGVIRPGCYWDEAYSTENYRKNILQTPYLRLLGFGGEQYRNGERLPIKSGRSLKSWIKWEMLYFFAGRYFVSEHDAIQTENHIASNLRNVFIKNSNLNLKNYKEYIRQIQSPSYRSLQASIENRLGFCLNTFLDTQLSVPSLLCIPFLGKSLSFQLNMIKTISPETSAIPNGYGFNFNKGESALGKIRSNLWQIIPAYIKHPLYAKLKKHNISKHIPHLTEKHFFISELEEICKSTGIPLDFKKHRLVRSRSRLMLNLGYFLKKHTNKITTS